MGVFYAVYTNTNIKWFVRIEVGATPLLRGDRAVA